MLCFTSTRRVVCSTTRWFDNHRNHACTWLCWLCVPDYVIGLKSTILCARATSHTPQSPPAVAFHRRCRTVRRRQQCRQYTVAIGMRTMQVPLWLLAIAIPPACHPQHARARVPIVVRNATCSTMLHYCAPSIKANAAAHAMRRLARSEPRWIGMHAGARREGVRGRERFPMGP